MSEDESPRTDQHASGANSLLPWQRKHRFSWTPAFETTFFRSLCESVHLGLRDNMTFKPEAWDRALASLREQGAYPTKAHLVNKTDNARKRFRLWRGLIENPLFTYDAATRTVSASEDAWQAHIETDPLARVLRDRPFDNAEYLEILFPDVVGSGGQPKRVTRLRRKGPDSLPDAEAPPGVSIMHVPGDTRTQPSQQQSMGGTPASAGRTMAHQRASLTAGGGVVPLRSNGAAGPSGLTSATGFPGPGPGTLASTTATTPAISGNSAGVGSILPPPPPSASPAARPGGGMGIMHAGTARAGAAGSALTPPDEMTNGLVTGSGGAATQKRQYSGNAAGSTTAAKRRRTDGANAHTAGGGGGGGGRNNLHPGLTVGNATAAAMRTGGGAGAGAGANAAGNGGGGGGGGGPAAGVTGPFSGAHGGGGGAGSSGPVPGPNPGAGGPSPAMTAVSSALSRLEGVSEVLSKCAEAVVSATALSSASTTRWPEQAFELLFQEFSDEDMDLQVRIAEKILTDTNKAVMFCKMPGALRKHWVKRLREASSRLGN